jgi:peroxiredoxin
MLQMRKSILCLALIFIGGGLFAQAKKGQPAPEIKLPDASGQTLSLHDMKGKVVLVDFWASWCGPCRKNNPNLVALYSKYKGKGFEILGVSIDKSKTDWTRAIEKDGLTWTQVLDPGGWDAQSTLDYGVEAIPAAFLIDKSGVIRGVNLEGRELEATVKKLLGK